jgi:hypothetical protein
MGHLVLTIFFVVFVTNQLANKTRNLLFAIQLLIYIIYGDRTIIGFVGLLDRPTDSATVSVKKSASDCEYVKLPFSFRVPKK